MPQYNKRNWAADEVITETNLDAEFAKIETAFNNLDASNLVDLNIIIPSVLSNDKADFTITLYHNGDVGASQSYGQLTDGLGYTPFEFTLVAVTVIAGAITVAAGNTSLKLFYDGSAASNAMAVAAIRTGYIDSSPVVTDFSSQKVLEIRASNGAGDALSKITMILHCKKQHVA